MGARSGGRGVFACVNMVQSALSFFFFFFLNVKERESESVMWRSGVGKGLCCGRLRSVFLILRGSEANGRGGGGNWGEGEGRKISSLAWDLHYIFFMRV